MIYSTVEGLAFVRFKVLGGYIPTISMIAEILKDRSSDDARNGFNRVSNDLCELLENECSRNKIPAITPDNKLEVNRIELDHKFWATIEVICKLTGHDINRLIIHQYSMSWYQGVAGNSSGGNPQSIRKGKRPADVNRGGVMERDPLSLIYPDFREADDYIRGFYKAANSLCEDGNNQMIDLVYSIDIIIKNRASIEEKMRSKGFKIADFFCKYCQRYHKFETFKVRENCGSDECKNKADNSRKLIDRKGWVHSPEVRPKCCVMGGSRRVKLNSYRLCLVCHLEIADCIKTFLV